MALKWPTMCWCAVKKLLTHSLTPVLHHSHTQPNHGYCTLQADTHFQNMNWNAEVHYSLCSKTHQHSIGLTPKWIGNSQTIIKQLQFYRSFGIISKPVMLLAMTAIHKISNNSPGPDLLHRTASTYHSLLNKLRSVFSTETYWNVSYVYLDTSLCDCRRGAKHIDSGITASG